ncbi:MAG: penicillin-binding transpeptidase domain-containing protein [Mycobacteriaceae bacterium]
MPPPRRLPALALTALLVVGLVACSSPPPLPDATAAAFAAALGKRDPAALAATTDAPKDAAAVVASALKSLAPVRIVAKVRQVQTSGDTARAILDVTWTLPKERTWSYTAQLPMARTTPGWQVRWSPADLTPELGANQSLALRASDPPTASVLDRNGTPVLVPAALVAVTVDPAKVTDLPAVSQALAAALGPLDPTITAASITAAVTKNAGKPYLVALLRDPDYRRVKPAIYDLPGVTFPLRAALLSPNRGFAPTLLNQVRQRVQAQLDGKAGWKLVTTTADGVDVTVLASGAAKPAPAVTLTLDSRVQSAAQDAVNAVNGKASVVVALQPSTGDVLAVAQNAEADADGPIALDGLYPPGSTFKIVTASAVLQAGIATIDTPVPCPGTTVVGTRRIPNYDEFSLGTVPLSTAFAQSCNTTFAQLATRLPADGLTRAGQQLGLGSDYAVDGITTVTGKVPPAKNVVDRAVDGFGQGDVVVSPFGMALVAAGVAAGATPVPILIEGSKTTVTDPPTSLPPAVLPGLRTMMRDVVTEGTARAVKDSGTVLGKTGEAQFGTGSASHAWFVGYRGDLAFATLIVGGGSSTNSVNVTRAFLADVPPGY